MARVIFIVLVSVLLASVSTGAATARADIFGYAGWATYYGIEDGFVRGDIMYDGTPYDPADPTITAASRLFPIGTWLVVCTQARCITVEVRDRGLLDENGILLDLSRAAYAQLFGGLGGKQWVLAYYASAFPSGLPVTSTGQRASPPPARPAPPPKPGKMQW